MGIKARASVVSVVLTAGIVALPLVAAPASAAKPAKPAAPVVIKVSPVSVKKKSASIRVVIEKAPNGVTKTVVNDGFGHSCTIPARSTGCTITQVPVKYPLRLAAVSWNKTVKGSRSAFIQVRATAIWVRDGYNIDGVKYPAAVSGANLVRLLGTSAKWTKFQAIKRSGVSSAGAHQAVPSAGESTVVFQVSGIVGLALAASNSSCGVGGVTSTQCAVGVAADGSSTSVYAPGSATPIVKDFYSAPNGKIYVVFNSPTAFSPGGASCVFAEVNTDTGLPTCVDNDISGINMSFGYSFGAFANGNSPVQFDDSGAVYYAGTSSQTGGVMPQFTLRKMQNGTITKLVSDNITMRDFVVLGDGTVILSGMTSSTMVYWLRKFSPGTGSISSLVTGTQVTFLRKFADGNVYWGIGSGGPDSKVSRYLAKEGKTDDIPWMAGGTSYYGVAPQSRNDLSGICIAPTGSTPTFDSFCQTSGSMVRGTYNLGTDRTVALTGFNGGLNGITRFVQYYPTVVKYTTVVTNVTLALQVGKKMLLTGTDKDGRNVLTLFDTDTYQETVLLDGTNEVEIYSFGYIPSTNKVMFNGLSFATNQYQVGDIVLP